MCQRQARNRLEPTPVADLRFILHDYAADIGHQGLRHRRFCLELACAHGAAEYAPLRTIYFSWEPIDVGSGPRLCGGGGHLLH